MAKSDKWENMDEGRQKSLIMALRDWVIKNQQNPNLFENIDVKWRNEKEWEENR